MLWEPDVNGHGQSCRGAWGALGWLWSLSTLCKPRAISLEGQLDKPRACWDSLPSFLQQSLAQIQSLACQPLPGFGTRLSRRDPSRTAQYPSDRSLLGIIPLGCAGLIWAVLALPSSRGASSRPRAELRPRGTAITSSGCAWHRLPSCSRGCQ